MDDKQKTVLEQIQQQDDTNKNVVWLDKEKRDAEIMNSLMFGGQIYVVNDGQMLVVGRVVLPEEKSKAKETHDGQRKINVF